MGHLAFSKPDAINLIKMAGRALEQQAGELTEDEISAAGKLVNYLQECITVSDLEDSLTSDKQIQRSLSLDSAIQSYPSNLTLVGVSGAP